MNSIKVAVTLSLAVVFFTFLSFAHDNDDDQSKSFTVSKGGTLEVEVNLGSLRVSTWDKNSVEVRVRSDESDEDADIEDYGLRMRQQDNTVRISTGRHYQPWGNMDIEVSIPVQFNVQLGTSAGDIIINGKVVGTVEAATSGGDIHIGAVEGKTDLTTSGGDVATGDIKGDLTLSTSGGDIHVGTVSGIAEVQTQGGDIVIDRVTKSLSAATSGGNVRAGDVGEGVTVTTSGGDIMLDRIGGNASLSTAGGNIELTSARGAVSATTAAGDIHADSIVGSIEASTSSGNIDVLLLPSGSGRSKLSTAVGDIQLFIPENAKASITAKNRRQFWGGWDDDEEDLIVSDFKEDKYDREEHGREVTATYTLNGGGQNISLQATMGKIRIFKPDGSRHDTDRSWKKKKKSKW